MARNYSNTAVATTLNGGVTDIATAWVVADGSTYPAVPFAARDEDEVVLVTAKSGTLDVNWTVERGYDGTSKVAHLTGTTVEHVVIAKDLADINLVKNIIGYPNSPSATDILWAGSDAAGMTTVTVSGSQTITEKDGLLSVLFSAQTAADENVLLAAHSFSIGDSFAVPVRCLHPSNVPTVAGLIFTDGTTAAANAVSAHLQYQNDTLGQVRCYTRYGTLTAMTSVSTRADLFSQFGGWAWMRLTYQASNTFRKEVSYDGISWTTAGISDVTPTMTPTHFGVMWSKDGGSGESIATYGPIVKLA